MENLSAQHFPLLASRPLRGAVTTLKAPQGLLGKEKLCWVDEGRVYLDGEDVTGPLVLSPGEKQLVSMGAYLLLFPDKLYLNTHEPSDCGSLEASFRYEGELSLSLCRADGESYDAPILSDTEPESPVNGMLWMDTSQSVHSLRQYSSAAALWVTLSSTYVRLTAPGLGRDFAAGDAVELSGLAGTDELAGLNGWKILSLVGEDFIVFPGLLDQGYGQSLRFSLRRPVPDMDFVVEAENRLWGCRYGSQNGESVNEIYGCALGDFRNWNRFQGLADDSYRVSLGSDGPFTGAVSYLGNPLFFKENSLHKLYIAASGAHRLVDSACRGVEEGCHKSLAVAGEKLFYKSPDAVCLYDGSLPRSVSRALGSGELTDARAGALGECYYLSLRDEDGAFQLLVYDSARALWHREDGTKALCFAPFDGDLYFIDEESGELKTVTGSRGEVEKSLFWQADSGLMGYEEPDQKYVSRLLLRLKLPVGGEADAFIQYDSDGHWHHAGHISGQGTRSFLLPLRPRRCDHFRLRLQGRGELRLYSMARIYEGGGDEP